MPQDPQHLRSQRLRAVNYQGDALRLGMNWTEEDLAKPQVLVDSAYGMGHPGLSGIGFLGKEGKRSGKTPLSATMNKSKAHRKQENGYALPGSIIAVVARGVNRLCPSK